MRSRRLGTLTSNFSEEKANDAGGGGTASEAAKPTLDQVVM